jgi:hypothetical protein
MQKEKNPNLFVRRIRRHYKPEAMGILKQICFDPILQQAMPDLVAKLLDNLLHLQIVQRIA